MKFTKIAAVMTACTLIIGCFGGCQNARTSSNESVTLRYVMPGPGMQEDSQKVWRYFNEKLQEKLPGVTVQFEIIPLSEYKQKFLLMNSSREQIDIASNYGLDFAAEVTNGTFAPLDDLLVENGKDMISILPEWSFEYMTINGEIYGIPTHQMFGTFRGINMFKDHVDKYLDLEKFKETLYSQPVFTAQVYDMLDKYISDMKADGLEFKTAPILNNKGIESVVASYGVVEGDEKSQVFQIDFHESNMLKYKVARDWYVKGYIRQDSLSATDTNNYIGKIDGVPFWDSVWTPFEQENLSERYGHEIITIPYNDEYYIGFKNSAMGTSVMASSKNKKQAVQFLNIIQSDKELYNILVYGIEGDHYTKVDEDRIIAEAERGQGSANDRYGIYKWIVGNTMLAYDHQLEPENYKKWVFEQANQTDNRSPILGFIPDVSEISDNITQVNAFRDEYHKVLMSGSLENWEEYLNEWMRKVDLAGNDKIIEKLQEQIDILLK